MRITGHLLAASVAVACFVGTASTATADTGSSALGAGSAATHSGGVFAGHADIIGLAVLLGVAPFQILTSGICDLATMSSLSNPCAPGTARYEAATGR
ncbi:hypothetical protein BOX37_17195 [Nocardia mangyaensis]|uniref:Uncharacterized protein n=1 Tax=Nocardia mangyaensis TaxID=2213200 RepID=A0A1J0VTM7_9NOCA|nr:hypothetical protein BOX37_17195 [Nocardia mangyaensis]